ncbi:MAG: hypothetical protein E6J69_08260 [Deltaproteobacteria bacterium]|nr:MAG: hypothetical protein E6J69_08260 [Deltaproteobacteria bacterium]
MEHQQVAIEVVRQYLEHEFPGRDVTDFKDKPYRGHTFRVDDETGTRVAGLTLPTAIVDDLHDADPTRFAEGLRDMLDKQQVAAGLRAEGRRKRVILTRDGYSVFSL